MECQELQVGFMPRKQRDHEMRTIQGHAALTLMKSDLVYIALLDIQIS